MSAGDTLFVVEAETVRPIARLAQSHKEFEEAWVRDLIYRAPDVLPTQEIREDAGAFLPFGTEIPLGQAGCADVFGIATGGYPVVVETKLWRNPEARRKVLAQTIDYVKEVVGRDYDWLAKLWQERRGKTDGRSLFDAAADASPAELDEAEFIDRVSRACRKGDVLGFIVGDGIQQNLVDLVDHLCRDSAHLRYSLALLELRCFQLTDRTLAVQSSVVREIKPVERAYINIEPAQELAGQLSIRSSSRSQEDERQVGVRTTLSADEFWARLRSALGDDTARDVNVMLENLQQSAEIELDYKQRAVMLKVPDPLGAKDSASVFAIQDDGMAYNSNHGPRQATAWGVSGRRVQEIMGEYYRRLHELHRNFGLEGISQSNTSKFVPVSKISGDLKEVTAAIEWVAAELRALRSED